MEYHREDRDSGADSMNESKHIVDGTDFDWEDCARNVFHVLQEDLRKDR